MTIIQTYTTISGSVPCRASLRTHSTFESNYPEPGSTRERGYMVENYGFPDTSRRTLMVTVAAVTFGDNWTKFQPVTHGPRPRCRSRWTGAEAGRQSRGPSPRPPASAASCGGVIPVTSDLADRLPSCVGPRATV